MTQNRKPKAYQVAVQRDQRKRRMLGGKRPQERLCPRCYGVLDAELVCRLHGQAEVCRHCKQIKPCGCIVVTKPQKPMQVSPTRIVGVAPFEPVKIDSGDDALRYVPPTPKPVVIRACFMCQTNTTNRKYCDTCRVSPEYQLLRYYVRTYQIRDIEARELVLHKEQAKLFQQNRKSPSRVPGDPTRRKVNNTCLLCDKPCKFRFCDDHYRAGDRVRYFQRVRGMTQDEAIAHVKGRMDNGTPPQLKCSSCGRSSRLLTVGSELCRKCEMRKNPKRGRGTCIRCGGTVYRPDSHFCGSDECRRVSQSYSYYKRSGDSHDTILRKLKLNERLLPDQATSNLAPGGADNARG